MKTRTALIILGQMSSTIRNIEDLKKNISAGITAWEEGCDPCAMADCDPSDQFRIGEELAEQKAALMELADELDEALGRTFA